jgi:DNA-binding CsgD family transcriptional regulator
LLELLKLARWSADLSEILPRIGDESLPIRMDEALLRLVDFDQSVVFAYPDARPPRLLFDGFRGRSPGASLDAYLAGTYLLDPFAIACANGIAPGLYRMRDLAPDRFFEGEYFNSWEVHPCISMESGSLAEEIGFLIPVGANGMAAYSLMRCHGGALFSDAEFQLLGSIEPLVRQTLAMHWGATAWIPPEASGRSEVARDGFEDAFDNFARGALTPQQRRIAQLILRGHSNASIGFELGISEGTAKNHRHAVYDRLRISSQSQLFALFIRHLSAPGSD